MDSTRCGAIRKAIGTEKINVLTDIFRQSINTPPGVRADRYRADHPEWLDILDRLESEQLFLQRQRRDAGNYQVRVYALPILENSHAQELVHWMEKIFTVLKSFYRKQLSSPVTASEISNALGAKEGSIEAASIKEALYYITDGHAVWASVTTGFPYVQDGTISVSEAVLRHGDFTSALSEFYDWHILNPEKRANAYTNFFDDGSDKSVASFFGQTEPSQPEWYDKLDNPKKALISELDIALKRELAALPMMGLRSLVESVMLDHIKDAGTFKKNLSAFTEAGFITKQHATLIEDVVDAGHAAIHRAYFPNPLDLQTIVETVRHLMHGVYILKPRVDAMSANIPKRQDRNDGSGE